jgi:PhnB protein
MPMPGGKIGHAEIRIGDSFIMLADEPPPEMAFHKSPSFGGYTTVGICLYVEDVDAVAKQAVEAGAKELRPVTDQFYGDRSGTFQDPFGHVWTISTHVEDVTPEEMKERMKAQSH